MNVYDFDKTIFYPDSSYCFVMFCLRHYPRAVLKALPLSALVGLKYLQKKADTKELKEKLFSFLPWIDDPERVVTEFWDAHRDRLQPWYLAQKREDDLIISASPEFLLRPICDELGLRLIATRMDPNTGKIHGLNCHDEEKIRRFRELYPNQRPQRFYSDSMADTPMAKFSEKAYLVREGAPILWPFP